MSYFANGNASVASSKPCDKIPAGSASAGFVLGRLNKLYVESMKESLDWEERREELSRAMGTD